MAAPATAQDKSCTDGDGRRGGWRTARLVVFYVLLNAGLLQDRKRGKWVYYDIAKELKPYQCSGVCCVGLVSGIGVNFARKSNRRAPSA